MRLSIVRETVTLFLLGNTIVEQQGIIMEAECPYLEDGAPRGWVGGSIQEG